MRKKYIYAIKSKKSGRVYIGQTVNPKARWYQHCYSLRRGESRTPLLQIEFNEYGLDNFRFEIIELTPEFNQQEIHWIDQFPYRDRLNYRLHRGNAKRALKRLRAIRGRNP